MKIAVVGIGKIGLPLAVQFASKGHSVTGIDINPRLVALVNDSLEPFPGEKNLAESLLKTVESGNLEATTSYEDAIPNSDIIVVVVPLFVDEHDNPDFGWMDSATESIGGNLSKDTLVIYETTLPIGTTRQRWKPRLEEASGLIEGDDFHVVFSPERVLTGRVFEDLRKYPKLVGGLSGPGARKAQSFYEAVIDFEIRDDLSQPNGVWDLGSAEAAEMAKLAETTYRDVNIALANQFARHAEEVGVDVYKVIEACNSQPFSHIHRPGISVGGHCIPVYPRLYLSTDTRPGVVRAARELNADMPNAMVSRLAESLGSLSGARVLILGVAYRSGVKEDAFSGVYPLAHELEKRGAQPQVLDPYYSDEEIKGLGLTPLTKTTDIEAIIVHTDHASFREYSTSDFPQVRCVLDGRNLLDPQSWAGTKFLSLGKP